ncbi:MAG TPA: hypothetical protein PLU35_14725, partial [Phycisphaerales bacterium]|nr:hypothetical protein [Phycisphaerales bacterium]
MAADDWIKMRSNLPACPKVAVIARETRLGAYDVIGRLLKLWAWADQHTTTGVIPGIDAQWIDRYVERRGFARAMMHEAVGWLRIEGGVAVLPDYTEHNGTTAKRRAQDAKRKGAVRKVSASEADISSAKRPQDVRKTSASEADISSAKRPQDVRK